MRAFLLSQTLILPILMLPAPALPALVHPSSAQPVTNPGRAILAANGSPDLPAGSKPSDYLRAAEGALATGLTDEAGEALEMAETRMLDRSVPLFQTNSPSSNPISAEIAQARQALAAHDRPLCMRHIQAAMDAATAQGL